MSKFLTIINGARRLATAITLSLGSVDGNKIVATKSDGRLDNSFIDWASPGAIGSATPNSGNFTTVNGAQFVLSGDEIPGTAFAGHNLSVGTRLSVNAARSRTVAIGYEAHAGGVGVEGVFLGYKAGAGKTGGLGVTAIGGSALTTSSPSSGNYETAIGHAALFGRRGSNNTAVGAMAGSGGGTASGGVYLGFRAGDGDTLSNRLHIANTNTESLILGSFADKWVQINGRLIVASTVNSTSTGSGSAVVNGGLGVALDIFGGGSLTLPGLVISSIGSVQTRGVGAGTSAGNARGTGSIDLQTSRSAAAQVASGSTSVIGGGRNNTASGLNAVSAGGNGNTASGQESCVGGGETNTASATYSFVPGGSRGVANKYGQQAHASGRFSADGDAQRSSLVARISTTDATPTGLTLDGVSSTLVTLANNQAWRFTIEVIAKQVSSANHAAFRIEGTITRGTTNASTAIGSSGVTKVSTLNGMTWDCNVSADTTNGALLVTVTGAAVTSIRWVAAISLVEVIA